LSFLTATFFPAPEVNVWRYFRQPFGYNILRWTDAINVRAALVSGQQSKLTYESFIIVPTNILFIIGVVVSSRARLRALKQLSRLFVSCFA